MNALAPLVPALLPIMDAYRCEPAGLFQRNYDLLSPLMCHCCGLTIKTSWKSNMVGCLCQVFLDIALPSRIAQKGEISKMVFWTTAPWHKSQDMLSKLSVIALLIL